MRGVGAGGIVSTAFCLLYKLYTLRLTRKQVNGLLQHSDSPYIRALGRNNFNFFVNVAFIIYSPQFNITRGLCETCTNLYPIMYLEFEFLGEVWKLSLAVWKFEYYPGVFWGIWWLLAHAALVACPGISIMRY